MRLNSRSACVGGAGRAAGLSSHIVASVLITALEQAVRVFVGVVDPRGCEVNALLFKNAFANAQRGNAGRGTAIPGVMYNQLHYLIGSQAHVESIAQMTTQLDFALQHNKGGQRDHFPLHRCQRRAFPDGSEQGFAKYALEIGGDVPRTGRGTAGECASTEHATGLLAAFVAVI